VCREASDELFVLVGEWIEDRMDVQGLNVALERERSIDRLLLLDIPSTYTLTIVIDREKMPVVEPGDRMDLKRFLQ
jgi:hypothetical protein